MSQGFFFTLVTQPLYNGVVILMHALPWADLGVIVVVFTVIVRFILFPLAQKALRTQMAMQNIQPAMDEVRTKFKNDSARQAQETMKLYKAYKVNPFASIFFLLVQIPIIFGLYYMFVRTGLPEIHPDFLYSFVSNPGSISTMFLGFLDVAQKSIPLAVLAGVSQFFQAYFMKAPEVGSKKGFGADFAKSMSLQMKYVFPVIIVFISYALPASVALYWTTSNLFSIAQEGMIRKKLDTEKVVSSK
ncbi:MAG: YidC/Oxa1 family membrane protein insertase [Candidatus Campbellbacteria bacterium]|nr:YidC/Oxa1 family membrane protein insertase [Candidatus Campbellbacteria bacterium]